jgi:hypothetical protein
MKLSALLALLMLGFTLLGGPGVGAQDSSPEAPFDPKELDGFQYGAMRYYTFDYSAMMEQMGTPGAEMEMPTGLMGIGSAILEFEEDGQAKDAFNQLKDDQELTGDEVLEGAEEVETDLGDEAVMFSGTEDIEGMAMDSTFALVQDGNYVYFVFATGSEVDVEGTVTEFTNTLIDNDGSGEGEFNEDGTSTGGLWDKFPAADDDLVAGLIASDEELTQGGE